VRYVRFVRYVRKVSFVRYVRYVRYVTGLCFSSNAFISATRYSWVSNSHKSHFSQPYNIYAPEYTAKTTAAQLRSALLPSAKPELPRRKPHHQHIQHKHCTRSTSHHIASCRITFPSHHSRITAQHITLDNITLQYST